MLAATLSPSYGIYSGFERCENVPLSEASEEYLELREVRDQEAQPRRAAAAADRAPQRRRAAPTRRCSSIDNLTFLETENEHLIAYLKRTGDNAVITCVNLDPVGAHEGVVMIPPELGLPAAFDVSDLLGDAAFTWRVGQQLRAPRAGPAAGPPAARRAVTGDDARWRALVGAQRWFGSKSRSARRRAHRRRRRSSRAGLRPGALRGRVRRRRARALPAALPRRATTARELSAGRSGAGARAAGALRRGAAARDRGRAASSSSSPAAARERRRSRRCARSAASSPTARSCSASA